MGGAVAKRLWRRPYDLHALSREAYETNTYIKEVYAIESERVIRFRRVPTRSADVEERRPNEGYERARKLKTESKRRLGGRDAAGGLPPTVFRARALVLQEMNQ
ncbi:hypothetical protein MRX96_044554 [Rhipicephalus microplus]